MLHALGTKSFVLGQTTGLAEVMYTCTHPNTNTSMCRGLQALRAAAPADNQGGQQALPGCHDKDATGPSCSGSSGS